MNLPIIDSIWRVKGSLTLEKPQSAAEVFGRLDDLFQAKGTTFDIDGDTLTFTKKDALSQDRMSSFHTGSLTVAPAGQGTRLSYDITSKTMMFCFALIFFFGSVTFVEGAETSGWVFAGIFATLYVIGRFLEPWLLKREFRKRLAPETLAPKGNAAA